MKEQVEEQNEGPSNKYYSLLTEYCSLLLSDPEKDDEFSHDILKNYEKVVAQRNGLELSDDDDQVRRKCILCQAWFSCCYFAELAFAENDSTRPDYS